MPDQEWMVGGMRSLALGRTFDGVLAWDSFFHLTHDDQLRMSPIFAAHCAPGGNLMFNAGFSQGEAVDRIAAIPYAPEQKLER